MAQSKRVSTEDHNAARNVVAELVAAKLQVAEQDKVLVQELAGLCNADRVIMLCLETELPHGAPIRVLRHAEGGFRNEAEKQRWLHFLKSESPTKEPVIAVACAIKGDLFATSILDYMPRDMFERSAALAGERGLAGIRDLIGCGWRHSPLSPRMTGIALHRLDNRPFEEVSLRRLKAFAREWKFAAASGDLGPAHASHAPGFCNDLTDSQVAVLVRILRGWPMDRIARDLGGRKVNTINHHATEIYRKYGAESRAELQALFIDTRMDLPSL